MARTNHYINVFSNTISYACLLVCGLYISKDVFNQYQDGKTAFQLTQHPLILEDFPSITICYKGLHWSLNQQLRSNNSAVAGDWMITYDFVADLHELQTIESVDDWNNQW